MSIKKWPKNGRTPRTLPESIFFDFGSKMVGKIDENWCKIKPGSCNLDVVQKYQKWYPGASKETPNLVKKTQKTAFASKTQILENPYISLGKTMIFKGRAFQESARNRWRTPCRKHEKYHEFWCVPFCKNIRKSTKIIKNRQKSEDAARTRWKMRPGTDFYPFCTKFGVQLGSQGRPKIEKNRSKRVPKKRLKNECRNPAELNWTPGPKRLSIYPYIWLVLLELFFGRPNQSFYRMRVVLGQLMIENATPDLQSLTRK